MSIIKNNWLITIVAAAVVAIVFFGLRAGLDSTAILALVGGISIAVGKLFHRMPPPVAVLLLAFGTQTVITGCAALQSLNEVRKDLCDILGDNQRAAIQAEADRAGIGFAEALAIWRATCLIRVQQAEGVATVAGMSAIRTHETPPQ